MTPDEQKLLDLLADKLILSIEKAEKAISDAQSEIKKTLEQLRKEKHEYFDQI